MKLITLFSGVGMQEIGMKQAGVDYKLINYCEYDKTVAKCFSLIHNVPEEKNLGDITKLDVDEYYKKLKKEKNTKIDLMISSFPCKSFSTAGYHRGFEDPKYGGLFDTSYQLISKVKPNIVIFENVRNITAPRYGAIPYITKKMNDVGYNCYDNILVASDFNIPQNRARWFMVCVKKSFSKKEFQWPQPIPLTKSLEKDIIDHTFKGERIIGNDMKECFVDENLELDKKPTKSGIIMLMDAFKKGWVKSGFLSSKVYSTKGISPTITCSNHLHFYGDGVKGKLTALERWRLMGLPENKFQILKDNQISDRKINTITGNGIVVDVFKHLMMKVKEIYF